MMINIVLENRMMFREEKSQNENQILSVFGGIPQNRSIIVLNKRTTGKPEEIYWAR